MKEKLAEMAEFIKADNENSQWARECDFKSRVKEFLDETAEIGEALEKSDEKNLKEELGDALYDLLHAIYRGEIEEKFTAEEVIGGVLDKIERRKPWVKEGRKVSKEEETRIWNEVKKKEKEGNL